MLEALSVRSIRHLREDVSDELSMILPQYGAELHHWEMFWLKTTPQKNPLLGTLTVSKCSCSCEAAVFKLLQPPGLNSPLTSFMFLIHEHILDIRMKRAWKSSSSLVPHSQRQKLISVTIERLAQLLPWRGETWYEQGSPGSHWAVQGLVRVM